MGRYETTGNIEDSFEPGSEGQVLKNIPGISDRQEIDEAETRAYISVMHRVLDEYDREHLFTASDICDIHRFWLGEIYPWAGKYRTVNISKGNFTFAMARNIPSLMSEFEKGVLAEFTPCVFERREDVIHALSVVHVELVLIHPFRDGNGRFARLLAIIMGLQAGFPPFDFSSIEGEGKKGYFTAVQEGMARNYEPMKTVFRNVVEMSLAQDSEW